MSALQRRRVVAALGAALCAPGLVRAEAATSALERIRRRGSLVVGLYNDMPPFHSAGRGIDVELARALARQLGVSLSMLPFNADENMADDLRNVVWRGHFLGWGPADVLMHVPVDTPLMQANPRVQILAPYYRERVAIAWRKEALPRLESLADLRGLPVAVAGQSLAGWLLIGAEQGALRESLQTRLPDGVAAAQALQRGEVVAAGGLASELESALHGDDRFVIGPLPSPRAPHDGWAIGLAIKKDATDLALALQQAMQALQASGRVKELFRAHDVAWHL